MVHIECGGSERRSVQNTPEIKITEIANSVDLNEAAQNEPSHIDLHCLPSSL